MSLNAISSGTMVSRISQMPAHKIAGQVRPAKSAAQTIVNSGQQAIVMARSREEATESASERALEAGSRHNTTSRHGSSINLFA